MKTCSVPDPLQPGDRLWVMLPSGTLRETTDFEEGLDLWRSRGYELVLSPSYRDCWGYLAGTDEARREAFREGLTNPDYRGILCGRGGYGSVRLFEDWTWPLPLARKWLIGFSDVTSLLWALANRGLSGVHGPVITTLATEPEPSLNRLWDWVEGRNIAPLTGKGWGGGTATGLLLPANLTVATHLLHTPLQPELDGVILALEDVLEAPYKIDRMLTQWRMNGLLRRVAGIALGRFSQCDAPPEIPSFTVMEVLRDRLGDLNLPIVADLPFGHRGENAVLPVGVTAQIDGDRGILTVPWKG